MSKDFSSELSPRDVDLVGDTISVLRRMRRAGSEDIFVNPAVVLTQAKELVLPLSEYLIHASYSETNEPRRQESAKTLAELQVLYAHYEPLTIRKYMSSPLERAMHRVTMGLRLMIDSPASYFNTLSQENDFQISAEDLKNPDFVALSPLSTDYLITSLYPPYFQRFQIGSASNVEPILLNQDPIVIAGPEIPASKSFGVVVDVRGSGLTRSSIAKYYREKLLETS